MKLPVNYNEIHPSQRMMVREAYVIIQKNLCYHCNTPLTGSPPKEVTSRHINKKLFPVGFFKWPVHLHHDHNTGMTIGAVHNYCNAVLWQYHGE